MKKATLFIALTVFLITSSIVYAKTITVDGDGSEWVPAEIIVDDPNADNGGAGQDIDAVYFTNNITTAFFRVDTVGSNDFSGLSTLGICMDSDNDPMTGQTVPECGGLTGVDFSIAISPGDGCSVGALALINYDTMGFSNPPSLNRMTVGTITEVEIGLTDIEIAADSNMPITVFKHTDCTTGGDTASATAIIGAGSPTAVTLSDVAANSQNTLMISLAMAASLMVGTAIVIKKRTH